TLAISDADLATVGAVAGELERHLRISDTQVGLLATATALVGALATVPVGSLTDRVPRVPLLTISVLLWAAAMVVSALSLSYEMLLISRMALGVVTATAGPTIASLIGDLFPAAERAKVYGWIQSGELAGGAVGLVAGGAIAGLVSWRASFAMLAVPALALAWGLRRKLPEPSRGGAGQLAPQDGKPESAEDNEALVQREVRSRGVEPDQARILRKDPVTMSLPNAVRYILSVPTNRVLIVASALGYFFFTGVQTFAVVLLRHRFGVGQTAASGLIGLVAIGAVLGVLVGGRVADSRVRRGHISARVSVAAVCYLLAVALLVPALITRLLIVALPLFFLGAGAVTAANPPLDAARLDVMPGRLWGRAEGVRTLLRQAATALAPIAFGLLSDLLASGKGTGSALSGSGNSRGDLHDAFLVLLVPLAVSGLILARGRKRFPRDVATAEAACAARGTTASPAPTAVT
ncbi:MAG: MFS transporter, partial [Solirubrobacterales bacterium]|nr:MFS transporter [Solirubrobacterales bacterium]